MEKPSTVCLSFQNLAFFLSLVYIFFLFSNDIDRLFFFPYYKNEAVWELLVISKLNGTAHIDTSEGVWEDFPVPDRITIKTQGGVGRLSRGISSGAEVIRPNFGDVVVMKVDDLDILMLCQPSRHPEKFVVVQVEFPQVRNIGQTAILHNSDAVEAQPQLRQIKQSFQASCINLGDLVAIQMHFSKRSR